MQDVCVYEDPAERTELFRFLVLDDVGADGITNLNTHTNHLSLPIEIRARSAGRASSNSM